MRSWKMAFNRWIVFQGTCALDRLIYFIELCKVFHDAIETLLQVSLRPLLLKLFTFVF